MSWISKDAKAKTALYALFRNVLVITGSVLATKGVVDAGTFETVSGAIITIGGMIASQLKARKTASQINALVELKKKHGEV